MIYSHRSKLCLSNRHCIHQLSTCLLSDDDMTTPEIRENEHMKLYISDKTILFINDITHEGNKKKQ